MSELWSILTVSVTCRQKIPKTFIDAANLDWTWIKTFSCSLTLKPRRSDRHLISLNNIIYKMKYKGHKKNGNDHQLTRRSMVTKQILYVSVLRHVWRTVWRICMMMLGCTGLRNTTSPSQLSFISSRNSLSPALREKTAYQSNCCMKCFNIAT